MDNTLILPTGIDPESVLRANLLRQLDPQPMNSWQHWINTFVYAPSLVSTGIKGVDSVLDGGLSGGVTVIASVSSIGKTALCLQIADYIANEGNRLVAYFAMEESDRSLLYRSTAFHSWRMNPKNKERHITVSDIKSGKAWGLDSVTRAHGTPIYEAYEEAIQRREFLRTKTGASTISEIEAFIIEASKMITPPLVVVDYLQIVSPDTNTSENEVQRLAEASNRLQAASKDVVPVLVVSSVSKSSARTILEQKENTPLGVSEGSTRIEYSATAVLILWPIYDQIGGEMEGASSWSSRAVKRVGIASIKNRYGAKSHDQLCLYSRCGAFIPPPLVESYSRKEVG